MKHRLEHGVLLLRATLFYLGGAAMVVALSLSTLPMLPFLSFERRFRYLTQFNRFMCRWLSICCGVRHQLIGAENLPDSPCVLASKHQSTWETLYLLRISRRPVASISRSNLRWLPFFGLGLMLTNTVFIERANPKRAMQTLATQGVARLNSGMNLLIFPEGTRIPPGQSGRFKQGAARVAQAAGVPLVPIALNAGECWPKNAWTKYPGLITVSIGTPIDSAAGDSRQLTEQLQTWIEDEMKRLPAVR